MQKIQMFHFSLVRVRGPQGVHQEERMSVCDADSVHHDGKTYPVGADGWIEVPTDVYEAIAGVHTRHPGGNGYMKWCTPADVDETVRLGLADRLPQPREPEPKRRTAKASAETA